MSTLTSEIIIQAFREGNFTAVGESTTAEELAESVPRLNNYIRSLLGFEVGEVLREWYVPGEWDPAAPLRFPLTPTADGEVSAEPWAYPPTNTRLVVRVDRAHTVYFPANPMDGARMAYVDTGSTSPVTLHGNGRLIEGAPSITGAPGAQLPASAAAELAGRSWLYRSDLGDWIRLIDLTPTDPVPLPPEFDDLLVTGLAMRLAPRFGVDIPEMIVARNGDMLGRLKKRYKQSERIPTSMDMRTLFREL